MPAAIVDPSKVIEMVDRTTGFKYMPMASGHRENHEITRPLAIVRVLDDDNLTKSLIERSWRQNPSVQVVL